MLELGTMSYTQTLQSTTPMPKVKTAYHRAEPLLQTNLPTAKPNTYIPYQPALSPSSANEPRTRKARPSPLKPNSELPPTLQIGQPSSKAYTSISSHFPPRQDSTTTTTLHPHNLSRSSSPRLHLTIRSAPPTPQKDIFKPLPPLKSLPPLKPLPSIRIDSCVPRKPVTSTTGINSPELLSATPSPPSTRPPSVSPPTSPSLSSSPPTPSISPISLSSPIPSPKYGDAMFHTLPEEAYPLISESRKSRMQQPDITLSEAVSGMDDRERPFWRAAIQPVIDPRSGMNYFGGNVVWG